MSCGMNRKKKKKHTETETQQMSERLTPRCLLTDHLQGVHVYVAAHHAALGVELGAAQAHGHADLPVAVAAHGQAALTLEPAGGPAAGAQTHNSPPLLNNATGALYET